MSLSSDEKLLKELLLHLRTGNFNSFVQLAATHLKRPVFFRNQIKEAIIHCLKNFQAELSSQTLERLSAINNDDINKCLLPQKVITPENQIGEILFPVVTSIGHVRKIKIAEKNNSNLSEYKVRLLDRIGVCVFDLLEKKANMDLFWDPLQFVFSIVDFSENEDFSVEGSSLGLPLSLALYSYITQSSVPPSISATGQVSPTGLVLPVKSFSKKIGVLKNEKHYVKHVLISEKQSIPKKIPGVHLIKVKNIEEAVDFVFKSNFDSSKFIGQINIENEIQKINQQYSSYFIDTCIKNIDKLIRYLKSEKCPIHITEKKYHLYVCYWRKGSCLCHQGKADQARNFLEKAKRIYHKNKGSFDYDEYLDLQISYAVVLKDVFYYNKAEKIHHEVHKALERIFSKDYHKGKNLSAQSQLYLAQNRFQIAKKLQKQAINLINENERYRNFNYLAQIYVRSKKFKSAKFNLDKAYSLLGKALPEERKKNKPFFDWVSAEYFYEKGKTLKKTKHSFEKLEMIAVQYPEINWYVPGLINKFYSLFLLKLKGYENAKQRLGEVVGFFENKPDPIHRLIGIGIRSEIAIYFMQMDNRVQLKQEIVSICYSLLQQNENIKKKFFNEKKVLDDFLQIEDKRTDDIIKIALKSLKKNIPY